MHRTLALIYFPQFHFTIILSPNPQPMKKLYSLTLLTFLLSSSFLPAQTFLNGSFESTTGSCNFNITNASFNSMMSNCTAFGSGDQIDILDNSCGYGAAENGMHFIGLAVDVTNSLTDALSIELSAPLLAGNTYQLSFYNRKDAAYNANLLEIGYSNTSASFGTAIDTAVLPGTTWDLVTVAFTPNINCSYITIRTIAGSYGWNFVDDLTITEIAGTDDFAANDATVQVYPNPTSGLISVVTSSSCVRELVTVKDIQGNTLMVSESPVIDMSAFAAGVYILEMETNGGRLIKRVVKE
jgi:hypothetical protein